MAYWGLAVPLVFGNVAGALVAPTGARNPARAAGAIALGACAVVSPHFVPESWPILRTVLAFATTAAFFRVIEILQHPRSPRDARLLSVVYPVVSPKRLERRPRPVPRDELFVGALFLGFAIVLFVTAATFPPAAPYSGLNSAMRTIVGGASVYFFVDAAARLSEVALALLGIDLGTLHDAPILALSVTEFWGRRWNRSVHQWLDEIAFRPAMRLVVRRRPKSRGRASLALATGVMAAFAASAFLHGVPILVVATAPYAAAMAAFFLIHGLVVVAEPRLGVARWSPPFARAWTLGVFAVTAPLFVEPLLRAFGR